MHNERGKCTPCVQICSIFDIQIHIYSRPAIWANAEKKCLFLCVCVCECKRRWLFHQKYLIQLKYAFYWFDVTAAKAIAAAVTAAKAADENGGSSMLMLIAFTRWKFMRRSMDEYRLYFIVPSSSVSHRSAPIQSGRMHRVQTAWILSYWSHTYKYSSRKVALTNEYALLWLAERDSDRNENETETNWEMYTNIIVFLRGISAHKKIIVISIISPRRDIYVRRKELYERARVSVFIHIPAKLTKPGMASVKMPRYICALDERTHTHQSIDEDSKREAKMRWRK